MQRPCELNSLKGSLRYVLVIGIVTGGIWNEIRVARVVEILQVEINLV